jgi:hypothetical protein
MIRGRALQGAAPLHFTIPRPDTDSNDPLSEGSDQRGFNHDQNSVEGLSRLIGGFMSLSRRGFFGFLGKSAAVAAAAPVIASEIASAAPAVPSPPVGLSRIAAPRPPLDPGMLICCTASVSVFHEYVNLSDARFDESHDDPDLT